jgi:hypothetical protein
VEAKSKSGGNFDTFRENRYTARRVGKKCRNNFAGFAANASGLVHAGKNVAACSRVQLKQRVEKLNENTP